MSNLKVETPAAFGFLYEPWRYKVAYGGRGGAKSWSVADALVVQGYQEPLRVLCAREYQNSISDSVLKLLAYQIERHKLHNFYDVQRNVIYGKNGTEFIFKGLRSNPLEIKSMEGIDIAWVEEAQKVSTESWDILIPTIRKDGSEIWATFNPLFKFDDTYQRFVIDPPPEVVEGKNYCKVVKVDYEDNPWFTDEMRIEKDLLKEKDYEKYLHVWEGEVKSLAEGAIFGKQITQAKKDGRVCSIPIAKNVEVHTFWDLGKNDHTAIWFMQHVGKEHRFIDYYEARLEEIEHYTRVIKDKGYLYGKHYMPHDVKHKLLGMERNRQQQFEDGGVKPIEVVARIPQKKEAIEMARDAFAQCYFDNTRCDRGLDVLGNYQYKYDEDRDAYLPNPVHNWASNGADAFMQYAQGYEESKPTGNFYSKRESRTSGGWMAS